MDVPKTLSPLMLCHTIELRAMSAVLAAVTARQAR
jgi:hypothetical protein